MPTATTNTEGRASFSITPQGPLGKLNTFAVKDSITGTSITIKVRVVSQEDSAAWNGDDGSGEGGENGGEGSGDSGSGGGGGSGGTIEGGGSRDISPDESKANIVVQPSASPYYDFEEGVGDDTRAVLTWEVSLAEPGGGLVAQEPTGFRIERKIADASWEVIAQLGASATEYIDSGLKAGRRYRYRVSARVANEICGSGYCYYRVPLLKSMDHRVRGAYAFKGGFLQYYVSDSPAALKHYLTETTVTDGSDSYTSGDYDFKWTGSSTWTEALAPPRPNKANGVVEWTDPSTWSGSYSFSYSEVSDEENYSYTRSGSGSRAAGGEWSGRHTSTTRSGSTISSAEGPGSGWDPGEPDHFVSASPTVEVREGSGFPNTTFTYTLSNEYTTEALISDVEFAITDYSEWLDSWWGWGGYEFDFWGWEYGTAWEESWEDGKDNYWERWRVAYRELSPNEVFYRLQVGEYRFNFNPSFKTEFKWNEVFVPQEVLTMADKEKANKLIKVHASHEITPRTQSPGYTIDPRDSGENGHYYLAPTSELIAFEPGAYEPSDEVERETGIEVRNAQANYAVLDVPWSSIPGCAYSLSWLHGSAFKVFACYYDEDGFLVEEEITSGQQFVEGRYVQFRIYAGSGAKPGDETKVTLTVSRDGTELNKSSAVFVVPDYRDRSYPGVGDASFPIDEAGGSRYRKVALNGTPLPDSKPQQTAETDQEPEQTFVDAMTLRLNHSVTDVYLPVPGSDIPLSARRDAVPEIWSERSGLRPQEDPSKPFGACWSTNLAPMVKITFSANNPQPNEPIQVHAIDEAGGSHLFVGTFGAFSSETEMKDYFKSIQASAGGKFSPSDMAGFLSRMVFVPLPAARSQQSPNVGSFSSIGGASTPVLMLKRKYGTTILYEISDFMTILPTDRLAGSQTLEITLYGRARLVRDRVGNSFSYGYSSSTNLVPSSITGGGMSIAILQDTRGLVTKIWDANGNETRFNYISHTCSNIPGVGAISLLDNVVAPGGKTTHFTYDIVSENDLTPNPPDTPPQRHWHCEIASIKDPLGNEYDFGYTFDHSKKDWKNDPEGKYPGAVGYYTKTGLPRTLTRVSLPGGGSASFVNQSSVWISFNESGGARAEGTRATSITDAAGTTHRYSFTEPSVVSVPKVRTEYPVSKHFVEPKLIVYEGMTVRHGGFGSERFKFDKEASMALKEVRDLSGNTTHYSYGDSWSTPAAGILQGYMGGSSNFGYYDDPTSQTNALGKTKSFSYTADRVMKSITDEEGRTTVYGVDSRGRRISETISGPSGGGMVTLFEYGSSEFPGFITKRTVKMAAGDPGWARDLVTEYKPYSNGRVETETVDPGGLNLTTRYTYDRNGNKRSVTDPRRNTTWFNYNGRNQLVTVTFPNGDQKHFSYDDRGNKTTEYDENGVATLFVYDSLNRLTAQVRDMNSNSLNDGRSTDLVTSFTYNAVGSKLSQTDPNGKTTTFTYDGLQRLLSTKTPGVPEMTGGYTTTFLYGSNSGSTAFDSSGFKPTKTIDPRGYVTDVTYDKLYRPTETKVQYAKPDKVASTKTVYDNVGNAITVTDALNKVTATEFDNLNRPKLVTFADTKTRSTFYTGTGFAWKAVDENGHAVVTELDAAGRPVKTIGEIVDDGTGTGTVAPTTKTFYDAAGNVAAVEDALGNRTNFNYDSRNRKVRAVAPAVFDELTAAFERPVTAWEYDGMGNVTKVTDPKGNLTTTEYDEANRPEKVTAPSVAAGLPITQTTYDKNGNVETITDPRGKTTTNTYDALSRLRTTTDAANIMVTYEYDAAGNRTSVKDGKQQLTKFVYDGLNRNTETIDPMGRKTVLTYNAINLESRRDAENRTTSYTYDARHRLKTVQSDESRVYTYDNAGNLKAVDVGGSPRRSVAYEYDALNRVRLETSAGVTHTYRYDAAGNRVYVRYGQTNRELQSEFDSLNRLQSIEDGTSVTTYKYDLSGNLVRKTLPNGGQEIREFDALNRATEILTTSGAGGNLSDVDMEYDLTGNVTKVAENYLTTTLNDRVVVNVYDNINRLDLETITSNGDTTVVDHHYDAANNRDWKKTIVNGGAPALDEFRYNALNQLNEYRPAGAGAVTYGYDLAGNRKTKSKGSVLETYQYDYENRLVSVTNGTLLCEYEYDYRTRRVWRKETNTTSSSEAKVIFSGGTSVLEMTGSAVDVEYVRGSDMGGGVGGILYTWRGNQQSVTHANHRGDVVGKTNAAGVLTYQASYDAFGTRSQEFGSTQDRQKANSKDEDPTGLLNEGFRYRDLETGIFLTRDPLGFVDGPNMYAYVKQSPWSSFDPHGLEVNASTETNAKGEVHTTFTLTGVIYDVSRSDRTVRASRDTPIINIRKGDVLSTHKQQTEKMYESIRNSIKEHFTGKEGSHSWSMNLDLKVVESQKDIKETDHVIQIVPSLEVTDTSWIAGRAQFGGTLINLSDLGFRQGGHDPAHELGHSFGLKHPFAPKTGEGKDSTNPISTDLTKSVMSYDPNSGKLTSKQTDLIQFYRQEGDLNGAHTQRTLGEDGVFKETPTPGASDSVFGRKRFEGGEFKGSTNGQK